MKDMMKIVYDAFRGNETILAACGNRIKYYIYPETDDTSKAFITIRPLEPPQSIMYASDKSLGYQFFYQIDVQSPERMECKKVQQAVKGVMWELGFVQQPGGLDEYFEETERFVDARRYLKNTCLYDTDY